MRPPGKDHDYIEVASLALEETDVSVRTSRVNIARVRLDGGAVRVARDAEGNINLSEFAATPAAAEKPSESAAPEASASAATAPAAPPPATPDGTTSTRPDWVVAAPDIAISGVQLDFEDQLVKPAATFGLSPVAMTISGFTTEANSKSRRVMEKIGLVRDRARDFDHPAVPPDWSGRRHVLYAITRDRWRATTAGSA